MTADTQNHPHRGAEPKRLNAWGYTFSATLAATIGALPGQCYTNALRLMMELPVLPGMRYAEGWITIRYKTHMTLVEHAWCEYAGGVVLDPSIAFVTDDPTDVAYFTGVRYTLAELLELTCPALPAVCSTDVYGPDGMQHPGYRTAYEAAFQHAQQLIRDGQYISVMPTDMPITMVKGLRVVEAIVTAETLFHAHTDLTDQLAPLPRALQPHLTDWETFQNLITASGEGEHKVDLMPILDRLASSWHNQSWYIPLKSGEMLTGTLLKVAVAHGCAGLVMQLDAPWQGITLVGGPITCFSPRNYQPVISADMGDETRKDLPTDEH